MLTLISRRFRRAAENATAISAAAPTSATMMKPTKAGLNPKVSPAFWIRPFGHVKGFADDHLHLDVGYAVLTPRGRDDYVVR